MLVLTRKTAEQVTIGDNIVISILHAQGGRVRIGISAPPDIAVRRQELISALAEAPMASFGRVLSPQ